MKVRQMIGRNRSGAKLSPELGREMVAATEEFPPSAPGDARAIAETRIAYAREGEPAATMPPPAGAKDVATKALKALRGAGNPNVLLDKLGERLAYERSGVRLYEALLSKHDAFGGFTGGPTRAEIEQVRDQEHQHFTMLADAVQRLGGDPTAVTPSANVQATATLGMCQALSDPRIDLLSSLEVTQTVELADNDCWTALIELLRNAGEAETAHRFEEALAHEREHLRLVRRWVAAGQGRSPESAGGASTP
ncbi:MAG: ferritin-like domain-containing protein, partial [Thermodesulfobacteriota bacterium]